MKIFTLDVGYLGTDCYAVTNDNEAVLIDPGDGFAKISAFLERENLTLKAVFLTHGHFDHIGAVNAVKEKYEVPVYIHKADYEMAKNPVLNSSYDFGGHEIFCDPDKFYEDGEKINLLGETFEIIHTPGHTEGGVCIKVSDSIFTGDTLFYGSIGRTDLYKGDYDTLMNSLKKLMALPGDYNVFPGHGEATTLSNEKKTNPFLR